jgi:hypothetical protein
MADRDFNIGVDIGKHGAIVVLGKTPFSGAIPPIIMPMVKDQIDYRAVYNIFKVYEGQDCHVVFERLGPIYGTSKATTYSMGYQSGAVEMVCIALNLPYTKIPPKTWQKEMFTGVDEIIKPGKTTRDTKAMALIAAKRLFPVYSLTTGKGTKPHDGIVDALLMAEYARRFL